MSKAAKKAHLSHFRAFKKETRTQEAKFSEHYELFKIKN